MKTGTAEVLISMLTYKPGWTFTTSDHQNRFADTIRVRIEYPARNSNWEEAPDNFPTEIVTYAEFAIYVGDLEDVGLYLEIARAIIEIETHELREFLRAGPTFWAPFHPHNREGMKRWSDATGSPISDDLKFGIC